MRLHTKELQAIQFTFLEQNVPLQAAQVSNLHFHVRPIKKTENSYNFPVISFLFADCVALVALLFLRFIHRKCASWFFLANTFSYLVCFASCEFFLLRFRICMTLHHLEYQTKCTAVTHFSIASYCYYCNHYFALYLCCVCWNFSTWTILLLPSTSKCERPNKQLKILAFKWDQIYSILYLFHQS